MRRLWQIPVLIFASLALVVACNGGEEEPTPTPTTEFPTATQTPVQTPTIDLTPTEEPVVTETPIVIETPTSEPTPTGEPETPTPEPGETPTAEPTETAEPVPTLSPSGIADIRDSTLPSFSIPRGTTVTWINRDAIAHTTTSGANGVPNGGWDSGPLGQDAMFSYTFMAAGTFTYTCTIHPDMNGTVTVTE